MKAIVIHETGDPSVLQYEEVATPAPRKGEVLVQAAAIGVNRPEIQVRKGIYPWMPPLPVIPGIEMAGRVVEIGEGVEASRLGEAVLVSARDLPERAGCYAEFIAVPSDAAHRLPAGCDLEAAACLSNYQVAHLMLSHAVDQARTRSVFFSAAGSGVGTAAIELAKLRGWTVVAGVSSAAKADLIAPLAPDHVVLMSGDDWRAKVKALTGGVDAVFDPIGGDVLAQSFEMLAPFGTVVSYGRLAGRKQRDIYEAMFANQETSPSFRLFTMHAFDHRPEDRRAAFQHLFALLAAGKINPLIFARFPLSQAAAAHEMMESRANVGKIILKPE